MAPIKNLLLVAAIVSCPFSAGFADEVVLVEVESLPEKGGWVVDQQFMDQMGSPYLLAHGLGVPVPDASGEVAVSEPGKYRVWVRTRDWVAPWKAPGAPGKFQLLINGKPLETTFGTEGDPWHWQDGGTVELQETTKISLHDLTGFEGRCDAILFAKDLEFQPPDGGEELAKLRGKLLGWDYDPTDGGSYDLVIIGGGVAGTTCSVSAARQGLRVALIQDRPVLGGNGSSEVRVWPEGHINLKPYPHVGDIVGELIPPHPPGQGMAMNGERYADARKEQLVRAEKNISLLLNHRAIATEAIQPTREKDGHIDSVVAQHIESGKRIRVHGKFFVDCTGDGVIAALVGADNEVMEKGNMGTTNPWSVGAVQENEPQLKCLCKDLDPWSFDFKKAQDAQPFPRCPWAIDMSNLKFPGRKDFVGQWPGGKGPLANLGRWFWESGSGKHPIDDMEWVRDYNFRAMYGAWDTLKNVDKLHPNERLKWSAYICGKRESRRIMGDVVLAADDFRSDHKWEDPAYPCTWHIDIHHPDQEYLDDAVEEPFIARATDSKAYHYQGPYWAPYRTLYSRNVDNLFMAGRDVSCTHDGLGAIRVMRTCGMMGETVGRAAWVAVRYNTTPRGVYKDHLPKLKELIKLPGALRRDSIDGELYAPKDVEIVDRGPILASDIDGTVIDDERATLVGEWKGDGNLPDYVGAGYRYSWGDGASATYPIQVKQSGTYEVQMNWYPHNNRARKLVVSVQDANGEHRVMIDQTEKPGKGTGVEKHFRSLGVYQFKAGDSGKVIVDTEGAGGVTHIDAVVIRPSDAKPTPAPVAKPALRKDQANGSKPDIIWILAEDISNELSCYGEPGIQTPNIDGLASKGVRYQRAYCTGPACSVSRSAMMSGVYQTRIDAHDHRRIGSFTFPAITQYLRSTGYFTAKGCGYSGKTDLNFKPAEKLFDGSDWSSTKRPVFAQITLASTHRKDTKGKAWNEIRSRSKAPVAISDVRLPPYFPDVPEVRHDWAVYLDQIEYIDTQVGEIVARLKDEGRYDNAMIIFCGDNGRCHLRGKNWLYEPGLKVPLIIKWPSGKRAGEVVDGMVSMLDVTATIVETVGAKPTKPLDGHSLNNADFTRDYIFAARDAGGEVKDHIRSVCNGRWKYIRNYVPELGYTESKYTRQHRPMRDVMLKLKEAGKLTPTQQLVLAETKPAVELYDLQADPHEVNNLSNVEKHDVIKQELASVLDEWISTCGDTGLKELESTLAAE